MYRLFLDETMTYSCALYRQPGELHPSPLARLMVVLAAASCTRPLLLLAVQPGVLCAHGFRLPQCK